MVIERLAHAVIAEAAAAPAPIVITGLERTILVAASAARRALRPAQCFAQALGVAPGVTQRVVLAGHELRAPDSTLTAAITRCRDIARVRALLLAIFTFFLSIAGAGHAAVCGDHAAQRAADAALATLSCGELAVGLALSQLGAITRSGRAHLRIAQHP